MWKSLLKTGCVLAAITLGASQAQALKIKDLTLSENTGTHEIHVRFDKSKNNWTTATSKKVSFKLQWYLKVRSLKAINSNSSTLTLSVLGSPEVKGTFKLKEKRSKTGITAPHIEWHVLKTFSIPGNKLILAPGAVQACQKIYAQGGRPSQSYRVYIGQITSKAEAFVSNLAQLGYSVREADTITTSEVYAVCDKDPDWKPPTRAGDGFEIANVVVHAGGNGNSCPKPHDLKVVFRAKREKTIKFRVRKNGKLSQLYTRTLKKEGQYYEARFDKAYKLDPGQTAFRIEVRDGPKSETITKTVTCPPFKVISTFMKHTHGNETYCPKVVDETTTFKTTRPGWVRYRIMLEGGLVVAEGKATSKRVGDSYIATVTRKLPFNQSYDGKLMAEVTNQPGANSGWTALKVDCLEMTGAEIKLTDPQDASGKHQCARQGRVKVEMRFNQGRKTVKYKVNCSNGFTKVVTAKTRKDRINGGYRVFGYHKFAVTKTQKVACSLMDMDHGSKVLTWTGREYACAKSQGHDSPGAGLAPETPPSTSQTPETKTTPTCTAKWKSECSKVPVRTCKPKTERKCKLEPVSTCTNKVTKSCKPKRKSVCKDVRGNKVCKVKVTRDCTRDVKRVCTRKMVRKCKSVTTKDCSLELKNKCERKKVVTCKR